MLDWFGLFCCWRVATYQRVAYIEGRGCWNLFCHERREWTSLGDREMPIVTLR